MTHDRSTPTGIVYLVGAGPGDPGLITQRGVACLQAAEVVVYDRLCSPECLLYAEKAEKVYVGKRPDHHTLPQEEINALLIQHARQGKVVVRLKGGDPFVFGRGGEEAHELAAAGIAFEIVPGVTSAIAAPAYAGIPVTFRDMAKSVAFITGHTCKGNGDPQLAWRNVSQMADTLVFLMGVSNLKKIVDGLLSAGRAPETPVALIQQGTLPLQKTVTGSLADIVAKAAEIKPPAIILVGEVAGLREHIRWFDTVARRPLLGCIVVNTRPLSALGKSRPPVDPFSRELTDLGAGAIHVPAFRIVPNHDLSDLDAAIRRLAGTRDAYQWVIFSSANAVHAFCERLPALGCDVRILGAARLAAVGPATAEALGEYALLADYIPESQRGADLARGLDVESGERVLLPQSANALPHLREILEGRGVEVHAATAYEHAPYDPDPTLVEMLSAVEPNLCSFFSPSAVQAWLDWLERAPLEPERLAQLRATPAACIGPTTADAAREAGLTMEVVAETYTSQGLLEAIVAWRARS